MSYAVLGLKLNRGGGVGRGVGVGVPRIHLSNPVSTQQMRDGVVESGVFDKYTNDIMHFGVYCDGFKPDWFTEYGREEHRKACAKVPGEGIRQKHKRIKGVYKNLLRHAKTHPIFDIEAFTVEEVMTYIAMQANQRTGKPLGKGGCSGKRSALFHMARCHNDRGWDAAFESKLTLMWKGFTRVSNKRTAAVATREKVANDAISDSKTEEEDDDDDRDDFKEGKVPMTPELFRKVCLWFVHWNRMEGIYAALYVALTWNLACRGNNTGRIRLSHMSWTTFDCLHINFKHTKTEHHGQAKRRKRAIYSNAMEYYIDVPFLLGMYLATHFNEQQTRGLKLFPGTANSQKQRAGDLLRQVLEEHKDEVLSMGYDCIKDLGLHSIRKGVSTYLASLPGGPSPAALSIRAGWSMGQVKDIYFDHSEGGDEFCGRCACLLNMMKPDFANSPAFFTGIVDQKAVQRALDLTFPHFRGVEGMERLLVMCIASLSWHSDIVLGMEGEDGTMTEGLDPNHPIRGIAMYRDTEILEPMENAVKVKPSWAVHNVVTGVPPYIKQLVDPQEIRSRQKTMVADIVGQVMEKMTAFFDERKIGGGELTETRINTIVGLTVKSQLDGFEKELKNQMQALATSFAKATGNNELKLASPKKREKPAPRMQLSLLGGKLITLPKDFQFPMTGVQDLWMKWNVGDHVRNIPALGNLKSEDFKFLDKVDKSESELRGATGKHKTKRRLARKTFSDIKALCDLIEKTAREENCDMDNREPQNLVRMCEVAMRKLDPGVSARGRQQHKWQTVIRRVRTRLKAEKMKESRARAAEVSQDDSGYDNDSA